MIGRNIEKLLYAVILLVTLAALAAACGGCASTLTPETKSAIAAVKNDAAIASAKADAATKAAEAAARANPAAHPVEWSNLIIQQIHKPLEVLTWICAVAAFVGVGLIVAAKFATTLAPLLSSIGWLVAPIGGCVSLGCGLMLFLLPWAVWILLFDVLAAVTLLVVQLAHAKWSIVTLLGLHNANSNAIQAVKTGAPLPPMNVPVLPVKAAVTSVQSPAVVGAQA